MPDRCDFSVGDYIDRQYRVTKGLGEGSFGKVFRVTDNAGHDYALKLLKLWEVHPDIRTQLVNRFDMEYETGRINSPYLVHSVGHGFVQGNPYIVMEFCPGGDLKSANQNTDWNKVGQEVLLGLKALHACGKVHRDLKPENVLIKSDGTAALTDFGISGDRNKRMTERNILGKPQQIFGTYAYMPPEQVNPRNGDATVLPTTDIFSFGVMMYELLTGTLPFGNLRDENELVVYIKNGREGNWDRRRLQSAPCGCQFQRAIEGCLQPDFKQRLQSCDEVIALLPKVNNLAKPMPSDDSLKIPAVVRGLLLRIMQGEEFGKTYDFTRLARQSYVLNMGRAAVGVSNDLPVIENQSSYVSRKHCTLEYDASSQHWFIRDGQWDNGSIGGWKPSLNGTFVNSKQVDEQGYFLQIGDIISIGDTKLRVEAY